MTEPKTLCMVPWLHRFTNEQGLHQLCCTGTAPRTGFGMNTDSLSMWSAVNGCRAPELSRMSKRFAWPCCGGNGRPLVSVAGVPRKRAPSASRAMNRRFGHWSAEALAATAEDGTLDRPRVRYADIRLGNVCNLTCRMCGPSASRLWAEHYNEVGPSNTRCRLKSSLSSASTIG